MNQYKGFELFNDVEDKELQSRNRGVVMSNIAEDFSKNQRISPNGAGLILGYFMAIPPEERDIAQQEFSKALVAKGWKNAAA